MASNLRISSTAKKDLDEIWLFIARDNPDAADRFIDFLTDRFPLLASFPRMGRSREDLAPGLRMFPVKNYLIFYRLLPGNRIEIVRVLHGARDVPTLFS